MMAPTSDLGDLWDDDYESPNVNVDCLLPTGIIVVIEVERDSTIMEIKAVSFPMFYGKGVHDFKCNLFKIICRAYNLHTVKLYTNTVLKVWVNLTFRKMHLKLNFYCISTNHIQQERTRHVSAW